MWCPLCRASFLIAVLAPRTSWELEQAPLELVLPPSMHLCSEGSLPSASSAESVLSLPSLLSR